MRLTEVSRVNSIGSALLFAALSAFAQARTEPAKESPAAPQNSEATVTFYSGGTLWKTGLPGAKNAPFRGWIFDGTTQLTQLEWRRYAVMKLPPGLHVFSATLNRNHAAANSQTSLTLEAGKSYYLRAVIETGAFTWQTDKGRLEITPCDVAAKDTADSAPEGVRIAGKDWSRRPRDGAPACEAAAQSIP